MKRFWLLIILFSPLMLAASVSSDAEVVGVDSSKQSVGLVLSGGGAKGIAHIGVIKALMDNDIPIDYVTGTSMGSIVGGLYAAGYTPEEMMALIESEGFSYWSTGTMDPRLSFYLNRARQTPAFVSVPLSFGDAKQSKVPQSLISPLPMNFAFMELFAPYTAECGGNFNRLMVPFRCVASDVAARHKVVLASGSLGDAIRSSMSFPAVFQPTVVDGMTLYDGGIYDNFPVDVMRQDFDPSIMIGVDVSTEVTGPQTSIIDQLSNMVVQNNDYSLPADEGIKIRINLNEFGLLDFQKAPQIYKIGYDHAMAMMDSIKTRIHARADEAAVSNYRDAFKARTPRLRFDHVDVTGGTKAQNDFVKSLFVKQMRNDTLSLDRARRAYYMALSTGKFSDLRLQATYNDTTDLFCLNARMSVKNDFKASFGGYLTSSNNSYIYLSTGYSNLSFKSLAASMSAWIGQSDIAAVADGTIYLPTANPSMLTLQAVASRHKFFEKDYLFYETNAPTFIVDHQYFVRMSWDFAAGYLGKAEIGAGFGHIADSFFSDRRSRGYDLDRYTSRHNLGQIFVGYKTSTLDDINFPTTGHEYHVRAMAFAGHYDLQAAGITDPESKAHPKWIQGDIKARNYFTLTRKWSLGLEGELFLSTRKLYRDYNSSLISSASYKPTPASHSIFNPAFRANDYFTACIVPVYRYSDNLSARLLMSAFVPWRRILDDGYGHAYYSRRIDKVVAFSELDLCYKLPFATIAAYANYSSAPTAEWSFGLSFGIYLTPPQFLR